jgi:hypothetical protein
MARCLVGAVGWCTGDVADRQKDQGDDEHPK